MAIDPTTARRALSVPVGVQTVPSVFRPLSSQWWIEKLSLALANRRERMETLEAYYRGTNEVAQLATEAYIGAGLAAKFPGLSVNHSKLIVNAAASRLVLQGFRLPGSFKTDPVLAAIWSANQMDAMSDIAHIESLVKGECPVLVAPDAIDGSPRITPQDPLLAIVWTAPGDPRIRLAAMKTWWDDVLRRQMYTLYLPDRIEFWQDRTPGQMDAWRNRLFGGTTTDVFEPRPMPAGQSWQVTNPLGVVPMVVLRNEPRLNGQPEGEHEPILVLNDLYNTQLMNMAMTSHSAAFPQRWGTGVDDEPEASELDPDTGEPIAVAPSAVRAAPDVMITNPNPEARYGQFAAADLGGYKVAMDHIRAEEASITFTPYHLLISIQTSNPQSGEAMTVAETGLVDKVRGHQRDKSPAWLEVARLALLIKGDAARARALREGGRVAWQDPERRTESQHVDALSKMADFGVPQYALWELTGAGPDELLRWEAMARDNTAVTVDEANAAGSLVRSGFLPQEALAATGAPALPHTGLLPVTLQSDPARQAVVADALDAPNA